MVKKVTFASHITFVTDSGVSEERDWGTAPFDFLGQSENLDFIQEQFERNLFILGTTGQKDLETLLSTPFFQCARKVARETGAIKYLKMLSETSEQACGQPSAKRSVISLSTLASKKSPRPNKRGRNKKSGLLRPKDIPGRFTPEQRMLRLMAGNENKLFEKFTRSNPPSPSLNVADHQQSQGLPSQQDSSLRSILKVKCNQYDDAVIDLSAMDEGISIGSDDEEDSHGENLSWEEDNDDDSLGERDSMDENISPKTHVDQQERSDDCKRESVELLSIDVARPMRDEPTHGMASAHFLPSWVVPTMWKNTSGPKISFPATTPTEAAESSGGPPFGSTSIRTS